MYSQYRCVAASQCLPLPEGTTPAEGASCFVNPLTVLGMVETMRREGHSALVHTAAASNLGQMLNRVCIQDGIGLVNIVRKPEQADLLRASGATYVCDSSAESFKTDLVDAVEATGLEHRVRPPLYFSPETGAKIRMAGGRERSSQISNTRSASRARTRRRGCLRRL